MLSSKHLKGKEGEEVTTERVVQPMQWGLVPSWHKGDPKKVQFNMSNCRGESMNEKRSFKVPLGKGRRCVVLAEGCVFYIIFHRRRIVPPPPPNHMASCD